MVDALDMAELERVTRDAWPADEQVPVGGWVLRAHHGVSRRANSVWTAAPEPEGWQAAAERFYGSHGLPVRLQVSDASPAGLDERLAAEGWQAEAATSVLVAGAAQVLAATTPVDGVTVQVHERLTQEWLEAYLAMDGISAVVRPAYVALFGHLQGAFALAYEHGTPVAAGLGVPDAGWLGLSCLVTAAPHRGRGIGGTMLHALAATAPGAQVWLQVVDDNPATRLYGRVGFERAYGYRYRTRPPH